MNQQHKTTAIFFDLFGVLLGTNYSDFIKMERSKINLQPYIDYICAILPKGSYINKDELKNRSVGSQVGEMPAVKLLNKLLPFYKVWIISNTSENHMQKLKTQFSFLGLVDGIITSELAGALKPNPEIFKFALFESETNPSSALFIDDNQDNVQSAGNLGFCVHHYVNYEEFEYLYQNDR